MCSSLKIVIGVVFTFFTALAQGLTCEEAMIKLVQDVTAKNGKHVPRKKYELYLTFKQEKDALAVAIFFGKEAWISERDPKTIAVRTQLLKFSIPQEWVDELGPLCSKYLERGRIGAEPCLRLSWRSQTFFRI